MIFSRLLGTISRRRVVYDGEFFGKSWFREWKILKLVLAEMIESQPQWQSIIDFGCGPGVMIDLMTDRGKNYIGCDYSEDAKKLYQEHFGRYPDRYIDSLSAIPMSSFDAFLAFDVFEHMRDDEIGRLLDQVKEIPDLLLNISRTRGIPGHINIKSDQSWIRLMEGFGYSLEKTRTEALRKKYLHLRPGAPDRWDRNLFLFVRPTPAATNAPYATIR